MSEINEYAKEKRNWENAFQKWSNKYGREGKDIRGCCGFGSMCNWCDDNIHYGRPCVRALNAMLREQGRKIDYSVKDFDAIW